MGTLQAAGLSRGRRWRAALAAALAAVAAGACGGGGQPGGALPPPGPAAVEVSNCGRTERYDRPPERVVAMTQPAIELVLALGLGDRLVGIAYQDNPVPPQYAAALARVPKLATRFPSQEVLLGAAPDLVIGGLAPISFNPQEGRSREDLGARGIHTYALQCPGQRATFQLLYERIREVGRIFGPAAAGRAERLAGELRASVEATRKAVAGAPRVKVFVYEGGESAPATYGGLSTATEVIETAGGENVFADAKTTFGEVSWEEVAARNPDAIIIIDYQTADRTAEQKRQLLASLPAIAQVTAVKQGRYLTVPFGRAVFGVGVAETSRELAEFLHPERF